VATTAGRHLARTLRLATGAVLVVAVVAVPASATISSRYDFEPVTPQRADQLIRGSTVQLEAFGCNLQRRVGSAVAIAPGRLISNAHVVGGSRIVDVIADGYPTIVADPPTVAAPGGDLGMVTAPALALPGVPVALADPFVGSVVRLGGYPSAAPGHAGPGLVVAAVRVVDYLPGSAVGQPWPVMRLSGAARPGMSGGPVLDQRGRLAGVVFGNELPTGDALAIPASVLRRLLAARSFVPAGC
jgi:S1-C subfamily serine protease